MDGNPLEQYVFDRAAETLTAWAIKQNDEARKRRENAVASWMLDAEVARGLKASDPSQPPAPAKLIKVTVPEGTSDQSRLLVEFGPELVADPRPCVLPPIQSYEATAFPQGVQAVGLYQGFGDIWGALPQDTIPDGVVVEQAGMKLRKTERRGFGNLRMSFYTLVK